MDDPTSRLPASSEAGVGGGGEERRSMLSEGSAPPARGKNGSRIVLANQGENSRKGWADIYSDFPFLLISGEERKAGRKK